MWEQYLDYFRQINIASIFVRFFFSVISGIVIGIDRGMKRRGAGIKTHVLVCLGATMVMMTGQYVNFYFGQSHDLTRMGAQVVSGIGFLGVGTIIVTGRNQVKGLTTAAGLWACACIGLAIGVGFYEGAGVMLVLVIMTLIILEKLDSYVFYHSKVLELYVELDSLKHVSEFLKTIRKHDVKITHFEINRTKVKRDYITAMINIELHQVSEREKTLAFLREIEGVLYIEDLK
ncbi:MAG: MgtC/SapB family protein [Clostridia bacterium]|nr:MgtC/SapB family protein [Clostridia bacterium]